MEAKEEERLCEPATAAAYDLLWNDEESEDPGRPNAILDAINDEGSAIVIDVEKGW